MPDLKQLKNVTANYHYFRGLILLPFGLFYLMLVVLQLWLPDLRGIQVLLILATTFIIVIALCVLVKNYYNRTFGQVIQTRKSKIRDTLITLAVLVLIVGAVQLEKETGWSISLYGLSVALLFLFLYFYLGRMQFHYLIMAGLMVIVSLLPLTGLVSGNIFFGNNGWIGNLSLALIFTFGGWFDHLILLRTLKPLPKEQEDGAF